jgi:predicted PurR-regulated permease PerM
LKEAQALPSDVFFNLSGMIRGRLRRNRGEGDPPERPEEFVEIDPADLTGVFDVPSWLRDVGLRAWLLVGVTLLLVSVVWLLSLTETIVLPVIAASVIAAVASPLVGWLERHRVPRAAGAALLMLGLVALGVLVIFVVVAGITNHTSDLSGHLADAKQTLTGWLKDLGVDPNTAENAKNEASSSATTSASALLDGLATGIEKLASLAFFLALTALSLFFLLKDGPAIRTWSERHLGVPLPLARTIFQRMLEALRGYFLGVTIVAAYNGILIGIGALILGVPLAGTIALITFFAAYVPYLGAWTAGAFSVLIALGSAGTDAAIGMAVLQLLANGILQQLVQPFAMGAALGIHPLGVLVVTIAGGALFGAAGLILAAPVVAAIVNISADVARARAEVERPPPGAAAEGVTT